MERAVLIFDTVYVSAPWADDLEETIRSMINLLCAEAANPPADGARTPTPSGEPFDGSAEAICREAMVLTIMATIDAAHEGIVEPRLVA